MPIFGHVLWNMINAWWIAWVMILDYDTVAIGLSRGIGGELLYRQWKFVNLRRVWLVHSTGY